MAWAVPNGYTKMRCTNPKCERSGEDGEAWSARVMREQYGSFIDDEDVLCPDCKEPGEAD